MKVYRVRYQHIHTRTSGSNSICRVRSGARSHQPRTVVVVCWLAHTCIIHLFLFAGSRAGDRGGSGRRRSVCAPRDLSRKCTCCCREHTCCCTNLPSKALNQILLPFAPHADPSDIKYQESDVAVCMNKLSCCRAETDWRTKVHAKGTCSSYGICGHRKDGDVLNCANNTVAQPISSSVAQKLQVTPSTAAHDGQTA